MSNRPGLVKQFNEAFSKGDRAVAEALLAPNFTFSAPPDPFLNREEFFERCWPQGHNLKGIKYVRVIENADEVIITHEYSKSGGAIGRNTDIATFADDKISRLEVFFGWDTNSR